MHEHEDSARLDSSGEEAADHLELPVYIVLYQDLARDVSGFLAYHGYVAERVFLQNPVDEQYVELFKLGDGLTRL